MVSSVTRKCLKGSEILLIVKDLFPMFLQNGHSGEDSDKDSIEHDERCLTELGRMTLEIFVLNYIFRYHTQYLVSFSAFLNLTNCLYTPGFCLSVCTVYSLKLLGSGLH